MLRGPRGSRSAVIAVLCLAGMAAAGPARAAPAAPGQIIGYAKADRSGASQVWALPPDKPYLYVPTIPAALNGRIEAVETGAEVGVALFKNPYFTSSDKGCQPTLGSMQQPGLAWLGATARFAPAPAGQPGAPPAGAGDGYGSLILYRTDLGPPPGALLLDRRSTLGLRCANQAHQTVYNRIFVPVAEAPETQRCFDLVGNLPGLAKPFQLDFINSDRLVMMMPGDVSNRYARIRHDFTVTLYDGLSCQGRSVALDSRSQANRDVRLARLDFRDRARSLRLNYVYGNADAFLVRREAPPPSPATAKKVADPAPSREAKAPVDPILAIQPIEDPAIGRSKDEAEQPSAPELVSAPAESPVEQPAPAPTPKMPAATQIEPEVPSAAPSATAAPAKSPVPIRKPAAAEPAVASAPSRKPAVAQAAVAPAPKTPPPVALGEPVTDHPAAKAAQRPLEAAPAVSNLPTIPKLSPRMPPSAMQTAALPAGPKTFAFPVEDLFRLNHCLYWQDGCGEPAATAWCRAKGYSKASGWVVDPNIGAIFPTVILGGGEVCAQADCDGFKEITCRP